MANSFVYQEEWATKLQDRLDHPTNFTEVMDVQYTNTRVLNNPYMTYPTVVSHTRGTAYTYSDATITNESLTISTSQILPQFIDRADLAQTDFAKQMTLAEIQGQLLQEKLESAMLAQHASWTDVGDSSGTITSSVTTQITVSASNIDDIIRGIKRIVNVANGQKLAARNGIFFIWRPADFELLEAFVQANGFATADATLKAGAVSGIHYMGADHYVSNDHTANHVFAGVKKVCTMGVLRDTYGQVVVVDEPGNGTGNLSAIGVVTRVDYGFAWWNNTKTLVYDVNVA